MLGGFLFGLGVSMPVGPVALVSIDYGVRRGFLTGFWYGLGVSLGDALFALVAYLGAEMVSDWLSEYHRWVAVCGALFLLFLGVRIMLTNPGQGAKGGRPFITGMVLTIANPLTILAFVAYLAIADVTASWIPGVFFGSLVWWTIMATITSSIGHRLSDRTIRWMRRVGGAFICVLAIWLSVS